jgi:hypothetical protein
MAKTKPAAVVVEPLNLDSALGKNWNRVVKMGVELEGGWVKNPSLPKGYKIEGDGSVFSDGNISSHPRHAEMSANGIKGELAIGPFVPAQMPVSVKKFYPELVDKTCGMHVHMSFLRSYEYALLADTPVYQETMLHYLLKWANLEGFGNSHYIWDRLKGKNRYCTKEFWPYAQMDKTNKNYGQEGQHRYTAISYQWSRYKTVECRVLPMMETPAQAIRAIKEVVKITNAYLVKVDKMKIRGGGKVELPGGETYSETMEIRV